MVGDFRRRAGGEESVRGLGFVTRVGGGRACVGVVSVWVRGARDWHVARRVR